MLCNEVSTRNPVDNSTILLAFSKISAITNGKMTAFGPEEILRITQLGSNRWQHFIYPAYPHRPNLLSQVEGRLSTLPSPSINNLLTVSTISMIVSSLFRWKTLVKLRLWRNRWAYE